MPPRRKLDWAKIRAGVGKPPNMEDGTPWLLVRHLPPPERRILRAIWRDGEIHVAMICDGRWHPDGAGSRTDLPVGWKPPLPFQEATDSGWTLKPRLPEPLCYGLQVT
jgi:hypothetical protein